MMLIGAVDNDSDKIDTDYIQMPYDNDNDYETAKVKWSIETNDIDNDFIREYDKMCKSMEDRQINDFYEA